MKRYLIELTYRGEEFQGWQIQKNALTVQGILKDTLERICGGKVSVKGAGRTDAGVHALQQFALIKGEIKHLPETLIRALNGNLPDSIRVINIREVDEQFDPLKSAKAKVYTYLMWKGETFPPFLKGLAFHLKYRVDEDIMERCAKLINGERDFASFMNRGSSVKNTVRKVFFSEFISTEKFLLYAICANGFLKQMVRTLVGTMIDAGRGKIDVETFQNLFTKPDRKKAGKTAPPHGLYLTRIFYDGSPIEWWRQNKNVIYELLKSLEKFLIPSLDF